MTIKEVEEKTGLTRSNIRFYEKEKLIQPLRNEKNGYREYSETDVADIKKIAYLRTLRISIEEIGQIMAQKISLKKVIQKQSKVLKTQISDLEHAQAMCERMLHTDELNYSDLNVEQFVTKLPDYWNENQRVFKLDSVSFLYLWGGTLTWGIFTLICLFMAVLALPSLPAQIPIQWSGGEASHLVDQKFIFAYPVICFIFRFLLRPFIWRWLQLRLFYSDALTDYLVNFLCFVALSVEMFTILFVLNIIRHITILLFIDVVVFLGIFLMAWRKCSRDFK